MAHKVIQIKLRFPDRTEKHIADTYGELSAHLWLIENGERIIQEYGNIEIDFLPSSGNPNPELLWTPPAPDINALERKIANQKEKRK